MKNRIFYLFFYCVLCFSTCKPQTKGSFLLNIFVVGVYSSILTFFELTVMFNENILSFLF